MQVEPLHMLSTVLSDLHGLSHLIQIQFFQTLSEVDTITIPIFLIKKLRFAEDHEARVQVLWSRLFLQE